MARRSRLHRPRPDGQRYRGARALGRSHVMSVHVGPKVPTDAREDHANPLARQIIEQIAHELRGGVVYICDRACVDDEPADGRQRAIHEGAQTGLVLASDGR